MTIDDIITVLQAAKQGKQLQRRIWSKDEWMDVREHPTWNFDFYVYRVKPEPREWDVRIGASALFFERIPGLERIKVREVLE